MSDDPLAYPARAWRKLTNNQRTYLMNAQLPRHERTPQSTFIVAIRAIDRMQLQGRNGRVLAAWALERGHARRVGDRWEFTSPDVTPRTQIDEGRVAEMVNAGTPVAEIAQQLGCSRAAVYLIVKRLGLTLTPRPRREPATPRRERDAVPRKERVVFQVNGEELAAIQQAAAARQLSVSAYLRALCSSDAPPA